MGHGSDPIGCSRTKESFRGQNNATLIATKALSDLLAAMLSWACNDGLLRLGIKVAFSREAHATAFDGGGHLAHTAALDGIELLLSVALAIAFACRS